MQSLLRANAKTRNNHTMSSPDPRPGRSRKGE
nr:MAG TPA: hypothetical protein [Caudoviricetes sp.]